MILKRKVKIQRSLLGAVYNKEFESISKFQGGKIILALKEIAFQKCSIVLKTSSINLMDEKYNQLYLFNYGFSEKMYVELTITDEKVLSHNIKTIERDDDMKILKIIY